MHRTVCGRPGAPYFHDLNVSGQVYIYMYTGRSHPTRYTRRCSSGIFPAHLTWEVQPILIVHYYYESHPTMGLGLRFWRQNVPGQLCSSHTWGTTRVSREVFFERAPCCFRTKRHRWSFGRVVRKRMPSISHVEAGEILSSSCKGLSFWCCIHPHCTVGWLMAWKAFRRPNSTNIFEICAINSPKSIIVYLVYCIVIKCQTNLTRCTTRLRRHSIAQFYQQ